MSADLSSYGALVSLQNEVMQLGKGGEQRGADGQTGICPDESFIDLEARYSASIVRRGSS